MPKVSLELEEQLSDSRSNEVAYRLKIINLGAGTLNLMNLNPQIPEGVELVEVKDSSTVVAKERHKKLCEELTQIVKDFLFVEVDGVESRILDIEKKHVKEIIKDASTIWRIYFNALTGRMEKRMEQKRKEESSLKYEINSSLDANVALDKWFNIPDSNSNVLNSLFLAKLEQLKSIESIIGADASTVAMATIEPDSFYATTYVLKFARSLVSLKKFNFSVEGQFTEKGKEESHLESVSTTVAISPRPYILSFITVFSALLGVALKFSIQPETPIDFDRYFDFLGLQLITGPGVSSGILALLMFNIFEHTSFSDKINMGVSWRSALLVGIVCGLFSERMIEALKVLVGG